MRILLITVLLFASSLCKAELIGQHLASVDSAKTFTSYLSEQGIEFKVDAKDPTLIWWSPNNDEHMNYVLNQAFKVPSNQQQLLPKNKQDFERAVSLLKELNIQHNAGEVEGNFVVLWFPSNSQQQAQFTSRYSQE